MPRARTLGRHRDRRSIVLVLFGWEPGRFPSVPGSERGIGKGRPGSEPGMGRADPSHTRGGGEKVPRMEEA
eukprot:scaffold633_cov321-Pavlova_lutheri.AAC.30